MNKDFCTSCTTDDITPPCVITKIPSNPYIEDILEQKEFVLTENFVCHTYAQIYENGRMYITDKCDECGLCGLICKTNENFPLDFNVFEKIVFKDIDKICIALKKSFPDKIIATKVQVKGNFRTKRIDLCIFNGNKFFMYKILSNTDKLNFYMRSYKDVIEFYKNKYNKIDFSSCAVIPASKINSKQYEYLKS